jgi:hypothetical protein
VPSVSCAHSSLSQALDGRLQQRAQEAAELDALKLRRPQPPRHPLTDDDVAGPLADPPPVAGPSSHEDGGSSGAGAGVWPGRRSLDAPGCGAHDSRDPSPTLSGFAEPRAAAAPDQGAPADWAGPDVDGAPPPEQGRAAVPRLAESGETRARRSRSKSRSPQRHRRADADAASAALQQCTRAAAGAPSWEQAAALAALENRLPFRPAGRLPGGACHQPARAAVCAAQLDASLWPRRMAPADGATASAACDAGSPGRARGGARGAEAGTDAGGTCGRGAGERPGHSASKPLTCTVGQSAAAALINAVSSRCAGAAGSSSSRGAGGWGDPCGSKSALWAEGDAEADCEAEAYLSRRLRRLRLPQAALMLQCAWRARGPRLLFSRWVGGHAAADQPHARSCPS